MCSVSDPTCCGFMKVVLFQLSISNQTRGKKVGVSEVGANLQKNFNEFEDLFSVCDLDIDYDWYRKNEGRAKDIIQKVNRRSADDRKKMERIFGKDSWLKLTDEERKLHRLFSCPICLKRYKASLAPLVATKKRFRLGQTIAKKAGLVKPKVYKEKAMSDACKVLSELNTQFKEKYNQSFDATLTQLRPGKKQDTTEKIRKQTVKDIENEWKKTSVLRFVHSSRVMTRKKN